MDWDLLMAFKPDRNMVLTDGTTQQTLVPSPSKGDRRLVNLITFFGGDTVASSFFIRHNDGSTDWVPHAVWGVASLNSVDWLGNGRVLVLRSGDTLTVSLGVAATTGESHVTAHWSDLTGVGS